MAYSELDCFSSVRLWAGSFPHTLAQHSPALGGKEGERGRGGRGKGRGEEKGRDPQGLVDTPHVPNPEKYPVCGCVHRTINKNIKYK